ncbi:MAG TPA: hypothetical protein VNQ97_07880, partial [Burkholderiaceae bacterium]|nr:hypothetical protein [Burkholderiaceae bacterium]
MNRDISLRQLIQAGTGLGALSIAAMLVLRGDPEDELRIVVGGLGGFALMAHAAFGNVKRQLVYSRKQSSASTDTLDHVLLHWDEDNAFTVRDLLNGGCCILGRTGSGKTSSSGKRIGEAIVRLPGSGGLILAA